MKVYIMADGEGKRWNNWGGVPKQLLKVNDETLLDRMIRLCKTYGIDDITIVGDFKNQSAKNIKLNAKDKVELWLETAKHSKEPFILLNGDIYYTDNIIRDAIERDTTEWIHYMCPSGNNHTGKTWPEGYLYKVVDVDKWISKLSELKEKIDKKEITLSTGWIINNWLNEEETLTEFWGIGKHDIFWCDETDDFDFSDMPNELNGFKNDYLRFIHFTGFKGME